MMTTYGSKYINLFLILPGFLSVALGRKRFFEPNNFIDVCFTDPSMPPLN